MATKTTKTQSDKTTATDSKPAQLAKIMYDGIVRMIRAKNAHIEEKNAKFELDSERKWRKNIVNN